MSKFKDRVHAGGDQENDFTEQEFSGQSERRQINPSDPKAIFGEPNQCTRSNQQSRNDCTTRSFPELITETHTTNRLQSSRAY